jgi:AraC-like DNA-binding protein
MSHTGLLSTAQIWTKLFQANGIDAIHLWREVGVPPELMQEGPHARAPLKYLDAAIIRVAARIPDEGWGLKMARCWHPGNLGVLGHAWLASSTLRTGLTRLARYWRIVGTRARIELHDGHAGLTFSYALAVDEPAVAFNTPDCWLALVLDMCRVNADSRICPVKAKLRRPRPANPQVWNDFYGCKVEFGAAENSFTLSRTDVDRILPTANRPLAGVLDGLLTEQLAKLTRDDVVSRCKVAFLEQLSSGEPSAEDVARQLHMSNRTLQRKLSEAGTSYQKLVDDTRRDLALRYIEDAGKSITDITFLLGFSGHSTFSRAFKRWTGTSPSDYRQRAAPSSPRQ